jgi:hypothetical protein
MTIARLLFVLIGQPPISVRAISREVDALKIANSKANVNRIDLMK